MKKLLFMLFVLCLSAIPVYADGISVNIDGSTVSFSSVEPQIIDGRTMVPLRDISNYLGADVNWNNELKQITLTKNDVTVYMSLNSSNIITNGYTREMDTRPSVINSYTMIPARYIAESFGYTVDWNDSTKIININKGNFVKAHFVDVGQGDCAVITDDNHCMVIDAGEEGNEDTVVNYIKSLNVADIDYAVATHPHSDHIGSLDSVINSFSIGNVIMPNVVSSSHAFENLISAIENNNVSVLETVVGNVYTLGNSKFTILAPLEYDNDNLNNDSAVIKLSYGTNSILFAGDAESEEESDILSYGLDISSDVLKVGHHGSSSSTSSSFLTAVNPDITVICVGEGNSYGHPTSKTLSALSSTHIYRTDTNGNIIVTLTGNSAYVETENVSDNSYSASTSESTIKNTNSGSNTSSNSSTSSNSTASKPQTSSSSVSSASAASSYILNTNSKKVHLPGCSAAAKIKSTNKKSYTGSISDLVSQGYTACKICKPF